MTARLYRFLTLPILLVTLACSNDDSLTLLNGDPGKATVTIKNNSENSVLFIRTGLVLVAGQTKALTISAFPPE